MQNHKIIRGLDKNHNCSNQVSHTRDFPCQNPTGLQRKIQLPIAGTFAIKGRLRARRRRARSVGAQRLPHPHTTFNKKEETGTREYNHHIRLGGPAGLRAKKGIQEETLKCWRKQQASGRQSAG